MPQHIKMLVCPVLLALLTQVAKATSEPEYAFATPTPVASRLATPIASSGVAAAPTFLPDSVAARRGPPPLPDAIPLTAAALAPEDDRPAYQQLFQTAPVPAAGRIPPPHSYPSVMPAYSTAPESAYALRAPPHPLVAMSSFVGSGGANDWLPEVTTQPPPPPAPTTQARPRYGFEPRVDAPPQPTSVAARMPAEVAPPALAPPSPSRPSSLPDAPPSMELTIRAPYQREAPEFPVFTSPPLIATAATEESLPDSEPPQPAPAPEIEEEQQPTAPLPPQPPSPYVIPTTEIAPEKLAYEINYCDRREFHDDVLATYGLARVEYFVYNTTCSRLFFQCSIGQTFVLKCSTDAEAFDRATVNCNFRHSVRYCPEYDHVTHCTIRETCSPNEFACCALPQSCLPLTKRCDGHGDCVDGDDENNCPSCKRDEFACVKSGKCIPAEKRCDGKDDDCGDGSNMDEMGCSKNSTCIGKFSCHASLTEPSCVDYTHHCDGTKDCANGEDEVNCKIAEAKYLLCENQKQSVTKQQWCDGQAHCADASDEKYCY